MNLDKNINRRDYIENNLNPKDENSNINDSEIDIDYSCSLNNSFNCNKNDNAKHSIRNDRIDNPRPKTTNQRPKYLSKENMPSMPK